MEVKKKERKEKNPNKPRSNYTSRWNLFTTDRSFQDFSWSFVICFTYMQSHIYYL